IAPLAVFDQSAVLDAPVLLRVRGPLVELGLALGLGQGGELVRVGVRHAVPAGQVLAVEQRGEPFRRRVGGVRGGRHGHEDDQAVGQAGGEGGGFARGVPRGGGAPTAGGGAGGGAGGAD